MTAASDGSSRGINAASPPVSRILASGYRRASAMRLDQPLGAVVERHLAMGVADRRLRPRRPAR